MVAQTISLHRRGLIAGGASALLFAGTKGALALPVEPPSIHRDYALDRKIFRTKLLKPGPAPEAGEPLSKTPEGAQIVEYRSGALKLLAWRSAPGPGKKKPAVLLLHGGNALGHVHWEMAQLFLQEGYVVMMPALRAENGLPGAFSGFYDETDDVLAAAQTLAAQADVNPKRIFVAGHSIGGTMTMLAAMSSPLFKGASAFSGNPNAFAFFNRFPEDIRFDTENPREFEMRSAVCYATSFKCPVLLSRNEGPAGPNAMLALTVSRAKAAGSHMESATVPGDHFSAIPEQIKHSLAFFAKL